MTAATVLALVGIFLLLTDPTPPHRLAAATPLRVRVRRDGGRRCAGRASRWVDAVTPYYTDEAVTLYHGDARDVLREMPGGSVDCIVTCDPLAPVRPYYEKAPSDVRFWRHVDQSGGPESCWPWTGKCGSKGYGLAHRPAGGQVQAHRMAYELLRGPIPVGLELDHLCSVRTCVNPAHLEAVTHTENIRRGVARRRLVVAEG